MRKLFQYFLLLILCSQTHVASAETPPTPLTLGYDHTSLNSGMYEVTSNLSLDMNSTKNSKKICCAAITIADNSTVVLNIPAGRTLTLVGSNASAKNGTKAYPAIELPASSTLVIKGAGKLIVTGGKGASPTEGLGGGNGDYSCHDWAQGGPGGKGGNGGYGSAPGIGTPGGKGGNGGECTGKALCPRKLDDVWMNNENLRSGNGTSGESTSDMGRLIVLGSVVINGKPGSAASFTQKHANYGKSTVDSHSARCRDYFSCGSGGGGGQGGASISAAYSFGAGAPGAGGGGAGGSGGVDDEYWHKNLRDWHGRGGEGGKSSAGYGGDGQQQEGNGDGGGLGGHGGDYGKTGKNGHVYYSVFCTFEKNGLEYFSKDWASSLADMDHDDIIKILPKSEIHTMRGANWSSGKNTVNNLSIYYGMSLSRNAAKVNIPTDEVFAFAGYLDQYGNQLYDSKGNLAIVQHDKFFPYVKNAWGEWFLNSEADITLSEIRQNTVRLYVNHYIEDPNYEGNDSVDCYSAHAPVYSEYKDYTLAKGEKIKLKLQSFHTMDGKLLDFHDDNVDDHLFYYAHNGQTEAFAILDGTQPTVNVNLLYDRNSFRLHWSYNDYLTDEQFRSLLMNEDTYTRTETIKYGQSIIAPELKQFNGLQFVYWEYEDGHSKSYTKLGGTMPAQHVTARFVNGITHATYLLQQQVDKTDTECDIICSKLTGINYQEPVEILAHFVGDTRLSTLNVTNVQTGDTLPLAQKNDSVFTFVMPGSDVLVNARFVRAHYGLMTSISNKEFTKVALKDSEGLYYTDDNDYFQFADSLLGGMLADMAVYQNERIRIIAEIDQSLMDVEESEQEFRPFIQVHYGNEAFDEPACIKNELYGGRIYRCYEYILTRAAQTHVKVIWTNRIRKKIDIHYHDCGYQARLENLCTDFKGDISRNDSLSAIACYNDYVCFSVDTDDPDFDIDNVTASYYDAYGNKKFLIVRTLIDASNADSKPYYLFAMPDRNTEIHLYTGKKVSLISNLPGNDSYTKGSDTYVPYSNQGAQGYRVILPETGVIGSEVPFFIIKTTALNDIKNPVAVYDRNHATAPTGFGYYSDDNINEIGNYGQGAFIVPDTEDDVELRNGYLTKIDPAYLWFSVRSGEAIILPYGLKAYTVTVNPDRTFDMSEIYGGFVPKGCAVIISIDPEWFEDFMDSDDDIFFLDTDPNQEGSLVGENDLQGVTRQWTCSELSDSLRAETGFDYDIYIMRYDPTLSTIVFEIAPYDKILYEGDAYLPVLHDGSDQPIFPTGIDAHEIIHPDPTTESVFSITGSQVNGAYRGIIIRKGKKILQLNLHK